MPDFVENSLNKIIRLRKKLAGAGSALRGLFGASEQQDEAVQKLESLKVGNLRFLRFEKRPSMSISKISCTTASFSQKNHRAQD